MARVRPRRASTTAEDTPSHFRPGDGTSELSGIGSIGGCVSIASAYAQRFSGGMYHHLDPAVFAIGAGVGRCIPDAVAAPDVPGDGRERLDDLRLGIGRIAETTG